MVLVAGLGINDAQYPVTKFGDVDGKRKQVWICPIYNRWKDLLRRANTVNSQESYNQSYINCTVHRDWLLFSNFKAWMDNQEWEGLHLDKDLLIKGNKEYGPEACAFVPYYINTCLSPGSKYRNNNFPFGVKIDKRIVKNSSKRFRADVSNVEGGVKYLGNFNTATEAHSIWQLEKSNRVEEYITKYRKETCFRTDVAEALMQRVWDLRLDNANGLETKSL